MRIDVAPPDAWGKLSETYRANLPQTLQDPNLNVSVFTSVAHAITEITRGLAQLYAHKKTIAIISDVDPAFESIAVAFSQDEFQVKMITPEQAKDSKLWTSLADELLFVLASEDDPITGKITDIAALNETLKTKRVFRLLVSHEAHNWKPLTRPEPFAVKILSLSETRALMIAGERCKIQPQVSPALSWASTAGTQLESNSATQIASELQNLREPLSETDSKERIQTFEKTLPQGFAAYFKDDASRLFDRSVIVSANFDGTAVIEELSATLRVPLATIGKESQLETTSACRWESPRFQDWLLARGETETSIRGLVVIDEALVNDALKTHLETAAAKIDRLQKGN